MLRFKGLQDAFGQATSVVTGITEFFDPKKEAQTTMFAVLGALSVGLAFLTVYVEPSLESRASTLTLSRLQR